MPEPGSREPAAPPMAVAPPPARAKKPLALLALVGWLVLGAGGLGLMFAWCWPARLTEVGPWWVMLSWGAFMLETFALHGALIALVIALFALATRRWRMALAALLIAGCAALPTLAMLARSLTREALPAGGGAPLRVLSMNLLYSRADADRVMAVIERERPDVVLLQEWTGAAEARYAPRLRALYRHERLSPRDDAFGQASFSISAMRDVRAYVVPEISQPQHSFVIDHAGAAVRIVNVHVLPPVSLEYFREQRLQTAALAEYARARIAAGERVVLAGDFNAIWASAHGRALRDAGLRDAHAEAGTGLGGTWPMDGGPLPIRPALGLDHVLVGSDMAVRSLRVLESAGSDHAPVLAEIGVGAKVRAGGG